AAALDYLADQLVLRESHGDAIEGRTTLPAALTDGMAVAALLDLEDKRTLPLNCGGAMKELFWNRVTAPSVHVRAPRRVASEVRECSEDYGDQQNSQNSDWPPPPTFFSLSREKWQQNKKRDNDYGANEESRRLHGRRQI